MVEEILNVLFSSSTQKAGADPACYNCTVILAHAQVVGGGAVRTLVRTLQRELLGRCLPCGGALNLHNHVG